jgi:hypothetical protein
MSRKYQKSELSRNNQHALNKRNWNLRNNPLVKNCSNLAHSDRPPNNFVQRENNLDAKPGLDMKYPSSYAYQADHVSARSKAWTVFPRSNAGIAGSNPTQGMSVCVRLFCVCVVLCVGRGLATGWSPVQGVLPTVYKVKKLKKRPRLNER